MSIDSENLHTYVVSGGVKLDVDVYGRISFQLDYALFCDIVMDER